MQLESSLHVFLMSCYYNTMYQLIQYIMDQPLTCWMHLQLEVLLLSVWRLRGTIYFLSGHPGPYNPHDIPGVKASGCAGQSRHHPN